MSLINQMLQDLDTRRAANGPKSGLPNEVRPLPAARRSNTPLIVAVGLAVCALVGWFAWQADELRTAQERRSELALQPVQPTLPVPALPAPAVALESAPLPVSVSTPAIPAGMTADDEDAQLRLMTSLRLLPERESSRGTTTAPATQAGKGTGPLASAPVRVPPPAIAPAPKAPGPVVLEKTTSYATGSSHELAENDYRKAIGALNAGRAIDANESLRAALKHDAAHTAARQLLFKLLVDSRRLDEAGEVLHDGLAIQPAQIVWAMSLARLHVDRGDLPAAWKVLQRSLPFAVSSADYQGFSGHVLQRLGRSKESVEHYQAATRLAPAEGRWWLGLGLAFDADGRASEARDAFLRARATGTLNAELIALVDQKLR